MDFLSLDDFKNTKADPKWSAFDYLLEVLSLDDFKNICSALKDNPWGRKAPSTISMAIATGYRKGKGKGRAGENMARRREVPLPCRLSIPFSQVQSHAFLTESEAELLEGNNTIRARLLEPSMMETENNGLKDKTVVRLWSFRLNSALCFGTPKALSFVSLSEVLKQIL
ncbi:hypothetical protein V6N12_069851 [Hibiscus sabdariffa]|uniref:Uncharacterized protein n=1 Tax=Hibiscus sabdariffa TaxID=183260 RepID=A0ABR2FF42_9ROSI